MIIATIMYSLTAIAWAVTTTAKPTLCTGKETKSGTCFFKVTYRDFQAGRMPNTAKQPNIYEKYNADFEARYYNGNPHRATNGLVKKYLNKDHKPELSASHSQMNSPDTFAAWYDECAGPAGPGLTCGPTKKTCKKRQPNGVPCGYSYRFDSLLQVNYDATTKKYFLRDNNKFLPLSNKRCPRPLVNGRCGWGDQPRASGENFGFTTEMNLLFKYKGGESFQFSGDDDLWVFIGSRLAVDIGGLHSPLCKNLQLPPADCKPVAATTTAMKLKRFLVGKSTSARSHTEAHSQQSAFCKSKGGRLPTRTELCPNYDASKASAPALGCEKSESWVPVAGSSDNWMFIGCPGTGTFHHMCKDHVTHHGKPVWSTGDQFGVTVDCMVPTTATCEGVVTFCGSSKVDYTFDASYLKVGQTYRFDLFHAERHSPGSNFNFETTLDLKEDTCKDFLQQLKAGTYTSSKLHPGLLVTDETCPTERFEFADSKDSSYCDIRKCKPGYEPVGKNYLRLVCNGDMLRSYGKGFKCRKITSSTATKATIASTSSAPTAPSTTRSTTSRLRTSRKPSSTSRSDTGTTQPPTTKGPNTPSSGTTPPFPSIPGAKTTKPSEGTTTTASGALLKLSGVAAAVMIVSMI